MKRLGIDIGSTTVKVVVLGDTGTLEYSHYERHHAKQAATLRRLLGDLQTLYPSDLFETTICGSGGKPIADLTGVRFVQEVVANAAAVCRLYPHVRTAIELGGQDAKVVFFHPDTRTHELQVSDMRMNGNCAGGTGAFIDEIAKLLDVPTEAFNSLAEKATRVYDISGRCGVFAKTDIQPLLIQGAAREDIALSTFHAITKQTIGGLAQGLQLTPPVIFEGGPLTFNPALVRVFAERLNLQPYDIIRPDHSETIVAYGAAIARTATNAEPCTIGTLLSRMDAAYEEYTHTSEPPLFASDEAHKAFMRRHDSEEKETEQAIPQNGILRVYIGIDSGSTTSKFVLMDEQERVTYRYYRNNNGKPLDVLRDGLWQIYNDYRRQGIELQVLGLGTTGYGELMLASAFGADCHIVETVAHTQAALHYYPLTTFLLDIGGQDMKAIWIDKGVITHITLNEACSSGCGSFLENFADTLHTPVQQIADAAFRSASPARLGSRCTVFMTSSIVNEQRNGKSPDDIMAGLCRSIIENVFTKVVRINNAQILGEHIVVQGGTFRNRAVLRAFEEYVGREVRLAPYAGEMGAIGAALLAKEYIKKQGQTLSRFIGFEALSRFTYTTESGVVCGRCSNNCLRTIMRFPNGNTYITGNKCERGAETTDRTDRKQGTDLFRHRETMLFRDYPILPVAAPKQEIVGIPRVLEFYNSAPFWSTFFRALGFRVLFSDRSNRTMYERVLQYVASDTICFPAKIVHGHIANIAEKGVSRIFFPYIMHLPPEGTDKLSPYTCSIIMGYPMVVRNQQAPEEQYQVPFDTPVFHWFSERDRQRQVCGYAVKRLCVSKKEAEAAYRLADAALSQFRSHLQEQAQRIIDEARHTGRKVIVLAGRPYHTDPFVSHRVSRLFTEYGLPVIPVDSLPGLDTIDLRNMRIEITNNFHTRMLAGAYIAATNPDLEYVQLVSFGCGHDAILSDEIVRIMHECGGKSPLIFKIDESEAPGSLCIRVQSFIETTTKRR